MSLPSRDSTAGYPWMAGVLVGGFEEARDSSFGARANLILDSLGRGGECWGSSDVQNLMGDMKFWINNLLGIKICDAASPRG